MRIRTGERNDLAAQVARHRLHARLNGAVAALPSSRPTPTYVVDLDAFDANAADLARRAGRHPDPGRLEVAAGAGAASAGRSPRRRVRGVLAYSLREALWLCEQGVSDDVVMGYPSVDLAALAAAHRLGAGARARSR